MNSNREWHAPGVTSQLSYFRRIHYDYWISDKNKCLRYPSNYVGLPKDLKTIAYTTSDSKILTGSVSGSEEKGYRCDTN